MHEIMRGSKDAYGPVFNSSTCLSILNCVTQGSIQDIERENRFYCEKPQLEKSGHWLSFQAF